MEEKTFFSGGDVSVTNARFMAKGQTYAMSGVTSVKSFQQNPSRKGPIILGILGLLIMAVGGTGLLVGLVVIGAAVAWWFSQKPEFSVLLSSASGEVKALASQDGDFISKVVGALNDAIVHRG
jgi:hypothetical protein